MRICMYIQRFTVPDGSSRWPFVRSHSGVLHCIAVCCATNSVCTTAFSFFFSSYYILLPFCLFCLNRHLPLLGPETYSLQACLSLCPSSNRVLSLSIALDIRLFLLIIRPLSSKLHFARLTHGNLDRRTGGADITASPWSLLALMIFCSARSIDHVGDLYPDSSSSSVRLVSSWMTVISSCSRSHDLLLKIPTAARNCPPSVWLHACSEALCSSYSYFTKAFFPE